MNFTDIIKKSVLEGFSYSDITTGQILVTFAFTIVLAAYIFMVYKYVTSDTFYNRSFNVSVAVISIVTAGIILAMQSSLVISLGMVGALSIVRFRTAIKEPMDLLFLFWSIGTGIICGAGLYKIAIVLAIVVTASIILLSKMPAQQSPYLLIVNASSKEAEAPVMEAVKKYGKAGKIKSKNLTKNGMDMIIELKTSSETELIDAIDAVETVNSVSILVHDGEVRG